ncbi:hypothetical protein JCM11641_005385 [Rhodosporidiobolus odoratus]
MSRAPSPRQFSPAAAAESLKSAFQEELDAAHRTPAGPTKPEIFKSAQATAGAWGGGSAQWGQAKPGAMADGKDFLQSLAASFEKAKAGSTPTAPVPSKANKK